MTTRARCAEDTHRRVSPEDGANLVGAGPYRMLRREPGRIVLGANPYWYGGTPRIPRVNMQVVRDDNTRALRRRHPSARVAGGWGEPGRCGPVSHAAARAWADRARRQSVLVRRYAAHSAREHASGSR